jgi:hypothetical protein
MKDMKLIMESFRKNVLQKEESETLNESEWLSGTSDEDYSKGGMFLFAADDKYELEGETTGLTHHAIKHAGDVTPSLKGDLKSALENIAVDILKYSENKPVYFKTKKGDITELDTEKIRQIISQTIKPLRNTLDFAQDKQTTGKSMSDIENTILKHVTPLVKKYSDIADDVIANPIATEKDQYRDKTAYVDDDNNLVITWADGIASLHGKKGDPEQIVQKAVQPRK